MNTDPTTTLPPNYLRLSSKWLETNPLPEDGLLLEADDTWKPSSQRGRITATPGFDYATARTDLPREAYADSEPGAEVASERVEEQATTCGKCGEHKHTPWRDNEYGYVCLKCLAEGFSAITTLRAQLDAKEAEVEHRAKQRDEFQNLFIEASDGFNRRGEQLARLTAELDAAQARCGALERAVAQARNWEFLDNHKEGCQMFGLHPKPCSCGKEQRIAYLDQFLAPSQQPDNLDSSGGESRTAIAGADGSKHTEGDCNPQGSESRKANPKIASESSASPAVNPSRPEPVKAGEWLPMETAPKRKVLLRIKTSPDAFRKVEALWINGQWDFDGMLFFKPVGWKPIAPEGKATEGEG